MGIKILNRFLLDKCGPRTIQKKNIQELSNKTIVIDTFIYLYKFIGDDKLDTNLTQMITILLNHNITPIFVFDGKPPIEKRQILNQRRDKKKEAEDKYNGIIQGLNDLSSDKDKSGIMEELSILKKQFIRITEAHIYLAKQIMTSFGVSYIEASGEADCICVYLVRTKKAWACLSDDTDMFVIGCPRVLRYFNLFNQTVLVYDMKNILNDLNLSMKLFRDIMVLSGTDYNFNDNTNLYETLKWFGEYKKEQKKGITLDFYDWLNTYTKYIQDYDKLKKVYKMFELNNYPELTKYKNMDFSVKPNNDIEEIYTVKECNPHSGLQSSTV